MSISLKRDSAENINAIEKKDEQILIETDKGKDNKVYYDDKLDNGDIARCTYGGFLTVDDKLNNTSKNPVENRVINTALHETQNKVNIVHNELNSISNDMFDLKDTIKGSKILWQRNKVDDDAGRETSWYLLNEKISKQNSGILIIFSRMDKKLYADGFGKYVPLNWGYICEFIPKNIVTLMGAEGRGYSFNLFASNKFGWQSTALRYMYIYDDKLVDNDNNTESPIYTTDLDTGETFWSAEKGKNNISYANDFYCIRYILGV